MAHDRNKRNDGRATNGTSRGGRRMLFGSSEARRNPGQLEEVSRLGVILDMVIAAGDAVMVSTTSDGGAVVLTVLSGDSREKAYASGQMELNGVFDQIERAYSPDQAEPLTP